MNKKELLIKFYNECQAKDCNNMSDSNQRIKAKVIASDLGLNYKNVYSLYEQAKNEYELNNLDGECLFDVYSNNTLYKVFKCSNGEFYCESDNAKYRNVNFSVKSKEIITYTYHPSKVIYTGASVGGVSMGGFHTTQDYTTTKSHETKNGYVSMSADGLKNIDVTKVTIDENIYNLIKVELYILGFNKTILCRKEVDENEKVAQLQVLKNSYSQGSASAASTASIINNKNSLSIRECETISNLLIDILSNRITKRTEKEYLNEIEHLIVRNNIKSLTRAKLIIEYFNKPEFDNYLEKLTPKYDEAIQKMKEQKILEEEQAQAKEDKIETIKMILTIVIPIILGLALGIFVGIHSGVGLGIFLFFGVTIVTFFSILSVISN